jgi:hypothetical protein
MKRRGDREKGRRGEEEKRRRGDGEKGEGRRGVVLFLPISPSPFLPFPTVSV